ncbi:acyltransferase family protein [Caballeronia sp.]|uniref:acyltransferase family protein n=1 Tax=Caballeronia sp. TaxID=1931223 RepID=UPI003C685D69
MSSALNQPANQALLPDNTHRIVALDGLRAIAVLAVFLQHALKAPLWMGVDLFFIISGFLITGILVDRKARGQSYFTHFYSRRARRILPPYLLLLVVSSLLFGLGWAAHWPWFAFFATNIGVSIGDIGHPSLNVLWSLAVEEQFYLVWPFVVLFTSERTLMWIAAAALVVVPIMRAIATPWFDTFWPIYYLTPFRMDLLCAGALMAMLVRRDRRIFERLFTPAVICIVAAVAALAYLHLHFPRFRAENTPLSNAALYSISLVLCASLVIVAIESRGIVKKVLCHPVLVYVGTISYTVYLIHLSILYVLWNLNVNRMTAAIAGLAITIIYASASWFLLEKRLTRGRRPAVAAKPGTPVYSGSAQ